MRASCARCLGVRLLRLNMISYTAEEQSVAEVSLAKIARTQEEEKERLGPKIAI